MSTYLIQSTDDIATALREISALLEAQQNPDYSVVLTAIEIALQELTTSYDTELTAISSAITNKQIPDPNTALGLIRSEIASLVDALDANTAAISALQMQSSSQNTISLSTKCCAELVYDCETGSATWIDAPNSGVGGTPGTGNDRTDEEGEPQDYTVYTDEPVVYSDELCQKANWVVRAIEDSLHEMDRVYKLGGLGLDVVTGILLKLGLIGGGIFLAGTVVAVLELPIAIIYAILAAIKTILSALGMSLYNGIDDVVRQDLVCAIVIGAKSAGGKGVKQYWNRTVDAHFNVVQPQNWLLKYLLHQQLADNLANSNLASPDTVVRYDFPCNCAVPSGDANYAYLWDDPDSPNSWPGYKYVANFGDHPNTRNYRYTVDTTLYGEPYAVEQPLSKTDRTICWVIIDLDAQDMAQVRVLTEAEDVYVVHTSDPTGVGGWSTIRIHLNEWYEIPQDRYLFSIVSEGMFTWEYE